MTGRPPKPNNYDAMRKSLIVCVLLLSAATARAQDLTGGFADAVGHWSKTHGKSGYARYSSDQYREIAGNVVAYQNEDGGWPKNLDMMARLDPDSVRSTIDAKHLKSTLDNRNVYTQVEFLARVFTLTGDTVYLRSARRGMEYMLATQYPNGSWRGWDADAATFNDGIMYGVLSTWLEVLEGKPYYAWVDDDLKTRIAASWDRGLDLVLKTQYVRDGVRTVWAQQYDHETLQPVQARSYELPGLSAGESADIVMLLMRIDRPSDAVVEAVRAAAAWFERSKIEGKRVETVSVPEGLPEDPQIRKDRVLVDDPDADPIWARYYELDTGRPFFCKRTGEKVYSLAEVPAERRVGYAWYGNWGSKVLKKYPEWLEKIGKLNAKRNTKRK